MNWVVTVTKGATSSHLAAFGYVDLLNSTSDAVPITNFVVSLRKSDGTLLSADVADSLAGDAATTASVDPDVSALGEDILQENAASEALTFHDGAMAPLTLNSPSLSVPAMSTLRIYFNASFKASVLNLTPGTPLFIEALVSFGNNFIMPSLATLNAINVPAATAANASVTLLDTTITTSGTVTVGSFAGLNQLLADAATYNVSIAADGGASGGTVCNFATLTSPNTTVATINGQPIVVPGINLSATDCDDIPSRPGPRLIANSVSSCAQIVTYDLSLFESDNGAVISATFNPASGSTFPFGTTPVAFTATDEAGISTSGTFYVHVLDTEAPVITALSNIVVPTDPGKCTALVTYTTTATDCNLDTVTFSPASGTEFAVGTTTVTITATDKAGLQSTSTFTVTVNDVTAPTLTAPNITVNVGADSCSANVVFDATAEDCTAVTLTYSLNPGFSPALASGASFPLGTTTVYVKATDASGNTSTGSFTVTVVDNRPPVLTAPNIEVAAAVGTCSAEVEFAATAVDCSGATLVYSLSATFSPAIVSPAEFPVGTTTVYVKATDALGQSTTQSFTVTVNDTQAPKITSPLVDVTVQPDAGKCYATFDYTPAAADNCAGVVTVSVLPASGTQFAAGTTTTVTVTATDSAGNVTVETFTVTVGVCLGKLGNYVWKDYDNDGVQDAGEPGVDGVKVTLFTAAGVQVGSPITTSGGGFYLFDNLVPGDYYVIFDKTTLPTGMVFTTQNVGNDAADSDANPSTGKSEGNATVVAGGYNDTVDAGVVIPLPPPCVPTTFTFNGDTSINGSPGNIRTYTVNGISVRVSAFSRTSSGSWASAYLGAYSGGLGVTDGSEDGRSNSHTVDNDGRNNYVLFEFSQPVVINRAYLGYVVNDSDLTVWVGNATNPYTNHLTLSDSLLSGFVREQDGIDHGNARWAVVNGGAVAGNVFIVAADVEDTSPDDEFKIAALDICAPTAALSLECVSVTTGTVGTTFSSALVASGGKSPYTFSIVSGSLPPGLTLSASTGTISGTPTSAGNFSFTAKVTDSSSGTAKTATVNCAISIDAPPVCVPTTFTFSGNSSVDGSDGNIRTYTVNGISVKVSAFSRTKGSNGSWAKAYLGVYSGGFGVTDSSENGSSDTHTVDNLGRDNFVLFEFSKPVVVNRAYLGYVVGDSDIASWAGNIPNAYNNHISLSDAVLNGLVEDENETDSSKPRWAKIENGAVSGNVFVIAANPSDDTPDDRFKIAALDICQPAETTPVTLGCVADSTGKVGVAYASSLRAEGGTPAYTFSIVSGSLPPGLTLNTSTGAITGTPTTKGTFTFTAKVKDSTGTTGIHVATQTCCITIAPNTTSPTGEIGSLVWKDLDGDGRQDANEPGISGITVQLKNKWGSVIDSDVTDSDGVYGFDGLSAGTYTVVVNTPSGYSKSPSGVGSDRAVDSNGSPATVTLATNSSSDLTIDFGFVPPTQSSDSLTTFTQGGWGSTPHGNNPGALLKKHFNSVYSNGYVTIGTSSKYLKFTSASAISSFLPQGGKAGTLNSSAVNPNSCSAGVLAGQLLAATLNVDFSNAGKTTAGLASKRVGSGPLKGKTVAQVLAIADSAIAGGSLPSGLTLSKLVDTLASINENYNDGDNNGYLY